MVQQNIDKGLNEESQKRFSRQLNSKTLKEKEQYNILNMNILLIGSGTNSSEIVKNLTRNGCQNIYLSDQSKIKQKDIRNNYLLSSQKAQYQIPYLIYQYFLQKFNLPFQKNDIGKRKDECMQSKIPSAIKVIKQEDINLENLRKLNINCIVISKIIDWSQITRLNQIANELNIPFILSLQMGLSFFIFSDFGKNCSKTTKVHNQHLSLNNYFFEKLTDEKLKKLKTYNDRQIKLSYVLLKSMIQFMKENSRLPKLWNQDESNLLLKVVNENARDISYKIKFSEEQIQKFFMTSKIQISYVSVICGAFTATEVLKSIIPRFKPLNQVLFWENLQLLQTVQEQSLYREPSRKQICHDQNVPIHYQLMFGTNLMEKVENLKILLVGCGATGCEKLKMLYQMGACRGQNGFLHIVDNDHINITNIPRQIFYNLRNVNQSKALVCKEWIQKKDPKVNVQAYDILINEKSENIFDYSFFENLDIIIVAVDSVEARHYLADKAIKHNKFLIESATLGFGAQSQCQIPHFSKKIKIEISTASCTIKSALTSQDQSLSYSKQFFTSEISSLRDITTVTFFKDEDLKEFVKMYSSANVNKEQCDEMLKLYIIDKFNEIYHKDIKEIGNHYPFLYDENNKDHLEFTQSLFGILKQSLVSAKGNENPISNILPSFDKDNDLHCNLVYQIAKLRSKAFNIDFTLEKQDTIGQIGSIVPAIIESTSVASAFAIQEIFTWLVHQEEIQKLYKDVVERNQQQQKLFENQISDNQRGLYLTKEQIKEVKQQFDKFGFMDYDGKVNEYKNLGRSKIEFELKLQLPTYSIEIQRDTLLSEIIKEINSILTLNNLRTTYMIKMEKEEIYYEDAETNPYLENRRDYLLYLLDQNFQSVIENVFDTETFDQCYILFLHSFNYSKDNIKPIGEEFAQIKLILTDNN